MRLERGSRLLSRWPARLWLSGAVALTLLSGAQPARGASSRIIVNPVVTPTSLPAGGTTSVLVCLHAHNAGAKSTLKPGDTFTISLPAAFLRAAPGVPEIGVLSTILKAADFRAAVSAVG